MNKPLKIIFSIFLLYIFFSSFIKKNDIFCCKVTSIMPSFDSMDSAGRIHISKYDTSEIFVFTKGDKIILESSYYFSEYNENNQSKDFA